MSSHIFSTDTKSLKPESRKEHTFSQRKINTQVISLNPKQNESLYYKSCDLFGGGHCHLWFSGLDINIFESSTGLASVFTELEICLVSFEYNFWECHPRHDFYWSFEARRAALLTSQCDFISADRCCGTPLCLLWSSDGSANSIC